MAHVSENTKSLSIREVKASTPDNLLALTKRLNDVCLIRLPAFVSEGLNGPIPGVGELIAGVADNLGELATLIILGEIIDLVEIQAKQPASLRYQLWIAIKRKTVRPFDKSYLPNRHFGALVYTRYKGSLHHTKTRIKYTYCPACNKTTKDYGGKKHTYHQTGTLISDVWRDIECDLEGDAALINERFADLFGLDPYKELLVIDCPFLRERPKAKSVRIKTEESNLPADLKDRILCGDCLEMVKRIPDNSIDFAFSDPPYNLGKKYLGYSDDLEIQDYFQWCDEWLVEMARVLKPGRTLAVLNIPLYAIRHFLFMKTILKFQNWIAWDALSFPVRMVMPAHYAVLCFSKGNPRKLPGLSDNSKQIEIPSMPGTFKTLEPLADGYCLRGDCAYDRALRNVIDRTPLTDLWGDIHRLKHNSRRVDHPCQLPPQLMYRLITIFTKRGEVVFDCFNGAGTTTLTAHQLGRRYVGIECSEKYCKITEERHAEILNGTDPFRKEDRVLTSKNSPVARLKKQTYKIPKKVLQLEVKRVANQIHHIPSREELITFGRYPIKYYDDYFLSWGEVTAAARTTGMTERREDSTQGKGKQLTMEWLFRPKVTNE